MNTLSPEQQLAFDKFKEGGNIFITGPGGTGKTKLISLLYEHSKMNDRKCVVCAMTGCASLLLNCGAKTIHSWSGMKIAKGEKNDVVNRIINNKKNISSWKNTDILIIDEVSMLSVKIFEILEEVARKIRKSDIPFGGMQVIMVGDFYQLPPVPTMGEPDTGKFCFQSEQWLNVFSIENHIELITNFRQKEDLLFNNILMEIRVGKISETNDLILKQYIGRKCPEDKPILKLLPIKRAAEYINEQMFAKIDEMSYEYHYDTKMNLILGPSSSLFQREKMQQEAENIANNMPCSKILSLKKGSFVMCVVNLDLNIGGGSGICNGSQGIVINFVLDEDNNDIPLVRFSNGIIKAIGYYYWESDDYPVKVGQIPLCLSWAITIHKIQGSTISLAEMDIGSSIFEYGQIYVALSRIQNLDGLYLINYNRNKIRANPIVLAFYNMLKEQKILLNNI